MTKQTTTNNLLPFPIIVSAVGGDIEAINLVLKHYEGYITVLATKRSYDKNKNPCLYVDEESLRYVQEYFDSKRFSYQK